MAYKGIVLIIIAAVAAVVLFLGLLCVLGFVATKKAWEHIMRDWENRDR